MKTSVCVTTYNHEKYIAQAIESVLMQKTDFDYELIIGEDDSQDNTRNIVKKYKERHPEKIKLFLNDRKNVIYINGRPTGRWNFINNLKNARGEYVALLEGDDYWTSPYKLQKQVDYLDSHPECALCFHDVEALYEDGSREPEILSPRVKKETYSLEDIIRGNFIHTCSVMFRNGLFGDFPDWFYVTPMADWPLHILNAQYGNIGYLNEVMGVYRIHTEGYWSTKEFAFRLKESIKVYKIINAHLNYRCHRILKYKIQKARLHSMRRYYHYQAKVVEKRIGLFLSEHGFSSIVNIYRRLFYPD